MKKLFVGNLPPDANEDGIRKLFTTYGTVRSIHVACDIFTGKCKGFGFVEMEGHEARAAIAALNGKDCEGKPMRVNYEAPRKARR
jgi:RNA recognition motif-containing protein